MGDIDILKSVDHYNALEPSDCIDDFITPEMFLRHKPFYEARTGRSLRGDANRHVSNRQ